MLLLKDGTYLYDGGTCYYQKDGKWEQGQVQIEMRWGEVFDVELTECNGKHISWYTNTYRAFDELMSYDPTEWENFTPSIDYKDQPCIVYNGATEVHRGTREDCEAYEEAEVMCLEMGDMGNFRIEEV